MNLQTLLNFGQSAGVSPRAEHELSPSHRLISSGLQIDHSAEPFLPNMNPYKSYGASGSPIPESSQVSDWKTSQRMNGPPLPRKKFSSSSSPKLEAQVPFATNGHDSTPLSPQPQMPPLKTLYTGSAASLRTVERFRHNEIKLEVPLKDGAAPFSHSFLDHPSLVTSDAYANQAMWPQLWRPEALAGYFPEVVVSEQNPGSALDRPAHTLAEMRAHVDQIHAPEDIWIAKDVSIMHPLSCVVSKAHSNCLGCSTFFNSMANVREELRPRGNYDMLRHESEHPETFTGLIMMNGSFLPLQTAPLACDTVNTLFHSDDPNGLVLWGFVPPWESAKLSEEDRDLLRQEKFVDPEYLERKIRVSYALQKVGQTICVPALWTFFAVRVGRGLSFSAQWSFLRSTRLADSRRAFEAARAARNYVPFNFSGLVQTAAFAVLDDLETADTAQDRRHTCDLLFKLLPVLKTQVLEDLLGERLSVSAHVVITYDMVTDQFSKKTAKSPFTTQQQHELVQIKTTSVPSLEGEIKDDDDEDAGGFHCANCKVMLWNLRRSCNQCRFDMCETCFIAYGKHHQPHKLRKYRKMTLQNLFDLVENIRTVLTEHEADIIPPPSKRPKFHKDQRDRERLDRAERLERERESRPRRVQPPVEEEYRGEEDEYVEELPTYQEAPPSVRQASGAAEDEETIDCICGNNKDLGFMISCELCRCWLHGRCVGINKKNEPELYYCPRCNRKAGAPVLPMAVTGILQPKNFTPDEKLRQYNLL
eukprot:TRINITY_DN8391_c0_g1_i1.p1 TRINITY_DN8391_c0_g1~~TRINITY_DN8391_c0_g1_i1.p1  ORF type:complete len:759 (-),score=165.60 TRINITY_DN8391_c0_g1_i1:293-2569(-)